MTLAGARVLVTGAGGFIGSHLAEMCATSGARVRALVRYNSAGSRGWLDETRAADDMEIVAGDVRDAAFCRGLTRDIDIVCHLAALVPIPYSYLAPDSVIETNVMGTLNLLQAARASDVRRFVHTSTSEVYGTARRIPMDEAHPLTPQSPYSASKIAADAVALSFHFAFGLPVAIARPFNSYGPRQSARAVIAAIVSQLASGIREVRLGDLTTTRDFTYVEDTCRGILAVAALDDSAGEAFNIGSDTEIAIGDLFTTITRLMNVQATAVFDGVRARPAASEVRRLSADSGKIARATGFRTTVTMEDGLLRTIEWFRDPCHLARYRSGASHV